MSKAFFEVFPTLKLDTGLQDLFEGVAVEKVTSTKRKDFLRVYIASDHLIHKEDVFRVEREIGKQFFPNMPIVVKFYEQFTLSSQYDPEKLMDAYRESILLELKETEHLSYLFIAHDISVVRYISDRIGVMYLGYLFEESDTAGLFRSPLHPYTKALLAAVPTIDFDKGKKKRELIIGELPSPLFPPSGCVFHTRCPYAKDICKEQCPDMKEVEKGHRVMCHLYDEKEKTK